MLSAVTGPLGSLNTHAVSRYTTHSQCPLCSRLSVHSRHARLFLGTVGTVHKRCSLTTVSLSYNAVTCLTARSVVARDTSAAARSVQAQSFPVRLARGRCSSLQMRRTCVIRGCPRMWFARLTRGVWDFGLASPCRGVLHAGLTQFMRGMLLVLVHSAHPLAFNGWFTPFRRGIPQIRFTRVGRGILSGAVHFVQSRYLLDRGFTLFRRGIRLNGSLS